MAKTTKAEALYKEQFTEAVQGEFAGKNAFMGSDMARSGAAVVQDDMPAGKNEMGTSITVPYFGTLGEFDDTSDGTAATPKVLKSTSEQATVARSTLAFEATAWAQLSNVADPYPEAARQMMKAAERRMDRAVISAACAAAGLEYDRYNAGVPRKMDFDLVVDARTDLWGDEQGDIAAFIVRSRTFGDMLKLKNGIGEPLLIVSQKEGEFSLFNGVPVVVSDALPVVPTYTVTEAGTTPPDITLAATSTGSILGEFNIKIKCTLLGARGTAKVQFSTDGGVNWSADITTAATFELTDTATDSLVGVNGRTGITATYENATAAVDNVWTATSVAKRTSLVVKKASLAFWYNRQLLELLTDKDILAHSDLAAMHLYFAAHRYRRRGGSSKCGVIKLLHN